MDYKENEFKIYINGVKDPQEQLSGSIYPANFIR